jgi:tetratricopeptide (TPR) repeat protein
LLATFKLLLQLLIRPAAAMSEILDRGSLLFASLTALAVSFLEFSVLPGPSLPFYLPLLVLAAVYVPCTLGVGRLFGQSGDYGSLLTCAAMAWTASQIPLIAMVPLLPGLLGLWLLPAAFLYFAVLMFFAVRNIFGMENGAAAGTIAVSWLPLLALPWIWAPIGFLLRWLASPFFIFYAWYFLGGELGNLGSGLRSRQNFHKMLEAAAINPHDGDAQYQLGLIYQQRRRYPDAIQRFQNAVAIDPTETDAHYQLGRIAREQGRAAEALVHFQTVFKQDPRHNSSEILRDLGGTYLALGNLEEAKRYLESYVERREYDPEGLYYYGQVLEGLGNGDEARQLYARAVEAARTAPRYRRRIVSRWSRLAQKRMAG